MTSNAARDAQIDAVFRTGTQFHQQNRLAVAQAAYRHVLELNPRHFDAMHLLGCIALQMNNFAEGAALIERAIAFNPGVAEAHYNRGFALANMGQHLAAIASFDQTIRLKPGHTEAHYNRAIALEAVNRPDEAVLSYDKAIALQPNHAGALNNRGNALRTLHRFEEAAESYSRTLRIVPDNATVYGNRGMALVELGRLDDAVADFEKAVSLGTDQPYLHGVRLHTRLRICQWRDFDRLLASLRQGIERGEHLSSAFSLLTMCDTPALHRKAAEIWTNTRFPANPKLGPIPALPRRDKIRVGYFSMDFREHAVAFLIAGLIEAHDREAFEIIAFSYGPDIHDAMRKRLETAFDRFVDVRNMSDEDVAALARSMELRIAVDLTGHTGSARTGIMALRAAPIQVNYLGYPGTMGASYMDYIIADRIVVPERNRAFFSEHVVQLPHCYQVNDSRRAVSDRRYTRAELGLPQDGFVFCCFNASSKISPATFDVWMRILKAAERSVLWLYQDNETAAHHLRQEAAARGIDPARLIFARFCPNPEHLARLKQADLVLDTLPYNAHTTASDALWVGVPVLTCRGEAFAGRVAASILSALGLEEMVMETYETYETMAVRLATDPQRLYDVREKIAHNRRSQPLFDTALYARHIEEAYKHMIERYLSGRPPESFSVGG